jgi:hypothetical protein
MLSLLRRPVASQSMLRAFSNAFAFNDVTTSRIKDASFKIEDGAKVCIMGVDEKGQCITAIFPL